MARYWVDEGGRERRGPVTDRAAVEQVTAVHRRERMTDALRRTLAGNVGSDDPGD